MENASTKVPLFAAGPSGRGEFVNAAVPRGARTAVLVVSKVRVLLYLGTAVLKYRILVPKAKQPSQATAEPGTQQKRIGTSQ